MSTVTASITTYNRADLVEFAVESVLAQSWPADEVIVVDDGSTDDTRERLSRFGERIRYIPQQNAGRAASRNRAIDEATGTYVAFLDSDDRWLPDRLARQVPVLDAAPHAAFVHGHVDVIDVAGRVLPERSAEYHRLFTAANPPGAGYAEFALESRCFTSTVLMRRDVLRALGGYDPEVAVEDVDLYLRIARAYEVLFLPEPAVAEHRLHGGQTGTDELTFGHIAVCNKHLAMLAREPSTPSARTVTRNLHLQLARCHHLLADGRGVRAATLASLRLDLRAILLPRVARQLALSFAPRGALNRLRARRAALPRVDS
jgi:hypothetical protein